MIAETRSVPAGYKHTGAGIYPDDWDVTTIAGLGRVLTGNTPPTDVPENYGNDHPFVSPFDLGEFKYISRTQRMLSGRGFSMARRLPRGTVLFVCIGSTIGKCGIAATELATNQQINAVIPYDTKISGFLHYLLCAAASRIKALAGEQAVPIVNKSQFAETVIVLPPTLAEREAISGALADVDDLIEALEELLAKKRDIKQGAMQELLTGKKRLPGFSGRWELKKLGDIGESLIGLTYKPADVKEDGVLVLRSSNISEGALRFEDNVYVVTDIPERIMVRPGDILICVRNGSRNLIGKCAKIDVRADGMTFGAFMAVFRTSFHDFVFHQFQSDVIKRQINEHLGATINQITNKSLNSFEIPLPPSMGEQLAIAGLLSDLDEEIAAIEAKLAKARQIKQGMMQELLTGRIRLV